MYTISIEAEASLLALTKSICYCNSRAYNVLKVRVVKYICVYGKIKAADQKYCHNPRWRRKLKEISFRTRGFGDNLDDFWPRYCGEKVLDLSRVVKAYFQIELSPNSLNVGRKNMLFQWTKTQEKITDSHFWIFWGI